jgi:hypothetical protein
MPLMKLIGPIAPIVLSSPLQEPEKVALCRARGVLGARNDRPDPSFPPHPVEPLNLDARM